MSGAAQLGAGIGATELAAGIGVAEAAAELGPAHSTAEVATAEPPAARRASRDATPQTPLGSERSERAGLSH